MKFGLDIQKLLADKRGQFWLAWATAFLVSQPLVLWYFSRVPLQNGMQNPRLVTYTFSSSESWVAAIAAFGVLALAWPLERRFARRNTSAVAAAFTYFGLLILMGSAVMMIGFPLLNLMRTTGSIVYLPAMIGMAAIIASPVALVARWIFPRVRQGQKLGSAVIWISTLIAAAALVADTVVAVSFDF